MVGAGGSAPIFGPRKTHFFAPGEQFSFADFRATCAAVLSRAAAVVNRSAEAQQTAGAPSFALFTSLLRHLPNYRWIRRRLAEPGREACFCPRSGFCVFLGLFEAKTGHKKHYRTLMAGFWGLFSRLLMGLVRVLGALFRGCWLRGCRHRSAVRCGRSSSTAAVAPGDWLRCASASFRDSLRIAPSGDKNALQTGCQGSSVFAAPPCQVRSKSTRDRMVLSRQSASPSDGQVAWMGVAEQLSRAAFSDSRVSRALPCSGIPRSPSADAVSVLGAVAISCKVHKFLTPRCTNSVLMSAGSSASWR